MGGIQQMQLDTLGIARAVALRPGIEPRPLQGDRCGIEQIQQSLAFPAQLALACPISRRAACSKTTAPAAAIGFGQRRTADGTGTQMIVMVALAVEARFELTKSRRH
ncbi:MAG: hypothetical protein IPL05_20795 [Betaproteobacteria bacterium]|nr:hypothetical protein [Betaproteobacteria bacterium]